MAAKEAKQSSLGRGLSALIGEADPDVGRAANDRGRSGRDIPIEFLRANPYQPRHVFSDEELEDLTNSIREKGVLQPIVVRPVAGQANAYEIVAGERRWRAAQRAKLHQIPVVIKDLTDAEALEVAIIENVQRADLNPVEEASGYQALMDQFRYTQEQLSNVIGKSRSYIANTLRLLKLPANVREMLLNGKLSAGHARTLITADDPEALAEMIVAQGMSVRQAEAQATAAKSKKANGKHKVRAKAKDADTRKLQESVSSALGLKVEIDDRGNAGGEVRISYKTLEQLDEVCRRLSAA